MPPVIRLQSAVDAHGWNVAIRAAERAIARGRQRVRKSGLRDEARGPAENAPGFDLENLKRHACLTPDYSRAAGATYRARYSSKTRALVHDPPATARAALRCLRARPTR